MNNITNYLDNKVKRSPVYDVYPSSMECECGCFAGGQSEMDAIRKLDPNRADMFEWIEDGIKRFGKPTAKKHSTWGGVNWTDEERNQVLTKYFGDDSEHIEKITALTCGSECGPGTMKGMMNY